jgi:hypothetical protein
MAPYWLPSSGHVVSRDDRAGVSPSEIAAQAVAMVWCRDPGWDGCRRRLRLVCAAVVARHATGKGGVDEAQPRYDGTVMGAVPAGTTLVRSE